MKAIGVIAGGISHADVTPRKPAGDKSDRDLGIARSSAKYFAGGTSAAEGETSRHCLRPRTKKSVFLQKPMARKG